MKKILKISFIALYDIEKEHFYLKFVEEVFKRKEDLKSHKKTYALS